MGRPSTSRFTAVVLGCAALVVIGVGAAGTHIAQATPSSTSISYAYNDAGRLTGVIDPSQANGTASFGWDPAGNLTSIARSSSTTLSVLSFAPSKGSVGTQVRISGAGFDGTTPGNNLVKFNGVAAVVAWSTKTQLSVAVPASAATGTISVTVAGTTATSSGAFTVGNASAPTIGGFSPNIGVAGTAVTVSGTNFATQTINDLSVFNTSRASVSAATSTSLSTSVPPGATSGPITVATPDGTVRSSADFFVPPTGYTAAQIGTTGRLSFGTSQPVSVSTAGTVALELFDASAGQRLFVNSSSFSFSHYVNVYLYSPTGTQLATNTWFSASGAILDTTTLPATGTYSLLFDPVGGTGSVNVNLVDVPADLTGTIVPGGSSITLSATSPGQGGALSFTGASGEQLGLGVSAVTVGTSTCCSTAIRVLNPDGSTLYGDFVGTNGAEFDLPTLPTSGTYKVVFDPQNADFGSATFTLSDDIQAGAITVGGANQTATIGRVGQNARLTFAGTAGEQVGVGLTAVSFGTSTCCGASIVVRNPDGSTLYSDFVGTNGAEYDLPTLPTTGTYTIFVDPQGTVTGAATFTLSDDIQAGAITIGGANQAVTIGRVGQNARLTFAGTAGEQVGVGLTAVSFGTSTCCGASIVVRKPDGTSLYSDFVGTNGAEYDLPTLPTTGTYTIFVDPQGTVTGAATFTLSDDIQAGAITVGGANQTATIGRVGQNARLTFAGTAGEQVGVGLTAVSFGTSTCCGASIVVRNPDGSTLYSDFVGTNGAEYDLPTLPTTGTYTIFVDPQGTVTGAATFTLSDDAASSITIGGAGQTISTSRVGQNFRITFSGTASTNINLVTSSTTFTGLTCCSATASILKPDGSALVSATFFGPASEHTLSATLPTTGTYTIFVDPQGVATGGTTLTLTDPPGHMLTVGDTAAFDLLASMATWSPTPPAASPEARLSERDAVAAYRQARAQLLSARRQTTLAAHRARTAFLLSTREAKSSYLRKLAIAKASFPRLSPEQWRPDLRHDPGDWTTHRSASPLQTLPSLQAKAGRTALAGQVLALDGTGIAGVRLAIGDHSARTDQTGRFLLEGLAAGPQTLLVDGTDTNRRGVSYGEYETRVAIVADRTTTLPFTVWLTRLDTTHVVHFSYPLTHELVLTNPAVPGLEVRIPAGSTIKDDDGKLVTQLGITPIPIDRPPFPLPNGVTPPVYFTVQPALTYIEPAGAQIIYPNSTLATPGSQIDFWNYDPDDKGWYIYGHGSVSANGRQVIPDADTRVWEFSGAMINTGSLGPLWHGLEDLFKGLVGDPVDPSTGLLQMSQTDLQEPDVIPLALTRIYRQGDTAIRPFGMGQTFPYAMFLQSANQYQEADLVLPNGNQIHYVRTSPGTGFSDAVFQAQTTPTGFYLSTISWNGLGWNLRLKDGTVYVFGENQPLQAIRDRYGNQVTITHSNGQSGNITQVTSPHGRWIKFTTGGDPNCSTCISSALDQSGRTVSYQYDTGMRLIKVTDVRSGITTYGWNTVAGKTDQLLTITDPRNITYLQNQYDANDRISQQTDGDGGIYHYAYTTDANNVVTRTDVTRPTGGIDRYDYINGRLTTLTRGLSTPIQQVTSYTRNPLGQITQMVDPLNRTTTYGYDSAGNLTRVTRLATTANPVTTTYTYEPTFNQLASATDPLDSTVTDPAHHTTTYAYRADGTLSSATNGANETTTFAFDPTGLLQSVTDPLNQTTSFGYTFGDLTSVTDALNRTTRQFVDSAGRVASTTDPLGITSKATYDAANDLTQSVDPLGDTTGFAYDPNGNLQTATDPRNHQQQFTYDNADQALTAKDSAPTPKTTTYSHDTDGNLLTVTDRRGKVTQWVYDALDRPTTVFFGKSGSTYASKLDLTWDAGNRLTKVVDSTASSPSGTIDRTYDGLDRLTQEKTTPSGSSTARGTINYTYDPIGRPATMTVVGQSQVSYGYDFADRLQTITQGTTGVSRSYDLDGRLATVTLPDGIVETYGYDSASELTSITDTAGSTTLGTLLYDYDPDGRRTSVGGTFARTGLPATFNGTYDSANRLTSYTQNGVGKTLSYDANGNLAGDGTNTYTFDAANRLTAISGGTTASFVYDGFGRRAKKTIAGSTTQFLYDGANVVQEQSSTGASTANLLTGLGVDSTYARTDSTGQRSLLTDAHGSTIALADAAGTLQTQYTYDPFGATTTTGQTNNNSFRYTGREADNTGLQYNRARYYNPALGRFISEDPIGIGGGIDVYTYADDNPVQEVDPSGLDPAGGVLQAGVCAAGVLSGRKSLGGAIGCLGGAILLGAIPIPDEEIVIDELSEDATGLIYRTGAQTDNALADASGVSFRDSVSSSADRVQVFRRGDKIWAVDTSKLPPGSVVRDGVPAGHVTVIASPAQIRAAIVDDPALRDLGLKQLDDGSYRLPK